MSLYDTRVQGSKIEGSYRDIVIASRRLDDGCTFVLFVGCVTSQIGDDQVLLQSFPEELAYKFDLLPSCKQVIERDTCDSGHLGVID